MRLKRERHRIGRKWRDATLARARAHTPPSESVFFFGCERDWILSFEGEIYTYICGWWRFEWIERENGSYLVFHFCDAIAMQKKIKFTFFVYLVYTDKSISRYKCNFLIEIPRLLVTERRITLQFIKGRARQS